MAKIGFDNDKYLRMQSERIRERIVLSGGKLYMDGGITDSIPFEYALTEGGCDKVIVLLTREESYQKKKESLTP